MKILDLRVHENLAKMKKDLAKPCQNLAKVLKNPVATLRELVIPYSLK